MRRDSPPRTFRQPAARAVSAVALISALAITPPCAKAEETVMTFGGNVPCQTWLGSGPSPVFDQGLVCLLGFWSGMNVAGALQHQAYKVGETMDSRDISHAVQLTCREEPGRILSVAAGLAYTRARSAGR